MLDWVKENPIYTGLGVTFVVSLILIISSSMQMKSYKNTPPPGSLKGMQVFGYILLGLVVIVTVGSMCTNSSAGCLTSFMLFN
jgi:hypothetical protein